MEADINLATTVFEFLEDDYNFEYHLKSIKEPRTNSSVITYYKDNTTVKITINHQNGYFNLNLVKEKDNSFTITSFIDKLLYQSDNCNKEAFEIGREKLMTYIN